MRTPIERAMEKVSMEPMSGCWLWTGALSIGGYGKLGGVPGGPGLYAHRVTYEAMVGPIPAGLEIDHKCRVRCCVNPSHLRVVTRRQNTLENSESASAKHARKQQCGVCGGPYSKRRTRNARWCQRCNAAQCRRRRVA